jgi:hypothetical protein
MKFHTQLNYPDKIGGQPGAGFWGLPMTAIARALFRGLDDEIENLQTVALFSGIGLLVSLSLLLKGWIWTPDFFPDCLRRFILRSFWYLTLVGAFLLGQPAFAQRLVDPDKVAPEHREAAIKRRAEQIRQIDCAHKADEAKVLPRDRLAHISHCLAEESHAHAPVHN